MGNQENERSNKDRTQEGETQKPIIEIYNTGKGLQWIWHGISGKTAEDILLYCFKGQLEYNIKKKAERSEAPKIATIKPIVIAR